MELATIPVRRLEPVHLETTHTQGLVHRHTPDNALAGPSSLDMWAPLDQGTQQNQQHQYARLQDRLSQLAISQWWKHYIDPFLIVQDELNRVVHDPRDFLALERTHLAYIRTCNVLALFGVVMAQLFVLKDADSVHGRWLAVSAYLLAIMLAMVSAVRTIWLQDKIIQGRTATSFWLSGLVVVLVVGLLIVVLIFDLRT